MKFKKPTLEKIFVISSEAMRNHPSSDLSKSMQFTSVFRGKSKKTKGLFS